MVVPTVKADLQLYPRLFYSRFHCLDLGNGQIHRLFAKDMLAGLGRLHSNIRVGIGRGADQHCIHRRIIENFVIILHRFGNTQVVRHLLGVLREQVANGHDLRLGNVVSNGFGVHLADPTGADDANAQFLHKQYLS